MKESRKFGSRVRITDVAEAAGVSVATVDSVINGRAAVRRPTVEKVMQAAQKLGFRAGPDLARRLAPARPARLFGFLLLQKHRSFYRLLAEQFVQASADYAPAHIAPRILHLDNLAPTAVAGQIRALGREVDALAVVAANHPLIAEAVDHLSTLGVPVFAAISEITAKVPVGYVGLDNHAVGRTAAWFIAQMARAPGKVGVLVGTHRFRCQDLNESGFRSYFREHAPGFEVIEPGATLEDSAMAAELTRHLLERESDLRGLYIAGGGISGVVSALREHGQPSDLVVIGNDRTTEALQGLLDGHIRLLLSHPLRPLCATLIDQMAQAVSGHADAMTSHLLELQIDTPESIR